MSHDSTSPTAPSSPSWSMVNKKPCLSVPTLSPGNDDFAIPVSNFFVLLQILQGMEFGAAGIMQGASPPSSMREKARRYHWEAKWARVYGRDDTVDRG